MKLKTRLLRHQQLEALRKFHGDNSLFCRGWRDLPYGVQRRALMLQTLRNSEDGIPVNNKYQIQTKWDMDLKTLIKKGVIKLVKTGGIGKRQSWVRLV